MTLCHLLGQPSPPGQVAQLPKRRRHTLKCRTLTMMTSSGVEVREIDTITR